MSSGFLSKMFKQEICNNAIEFDYAVFGMQSFKIQDPLRWLQETQGTYLKGEKKKTWNILLHQKNVWCNSK